MTGRIDTKRRSRLWLATALAAMAAVALTVAVAYADLGQTQITSTRRVHEYQPAANGTYIAWDRVSPAHPKHTDIYARPFGGVAFKVNADGTNGGGGGIDGTTLVYSQWKKKGSPGNLHLIDLVTQVRTRLPAIVNTRRGDEYWPSISGDWIEFQRKTRRFKREYIYNTSTRELRKLDEVPASGYIESGQVNGNYVTWMKCGRVTCKVRLYDIAAQKTTVLRVSPGRYQFGAAVTADGTLYYGEGHITRCGRAVRLMKRPLGGPPTTLVSFNRGTDFESTYAYTNTGGTDLYYAKLHCSTGATDIYRVTSP